jgi:hypothetical protein
LILVLGGSNVTHHGGGGGDYGAMIVARYNAMGGFLPPSFDTSGGGNWTMQFDADQVRKELLSPRPGALGVREY